MWTYTQSVELNPWQEAPEAACFAKPAHDAAEAAPKILQYWDLPEKAPASSLLGLLQAQGRFLYSVRKPAVQNFAGVETHAWVLANPIQVGGAEVGEAQSDPEEIRRSLNFVRRGSTLARTLTMNGYRPVLTEEIREGVKPLVPDDFGAQADEARALMACLGTITSAPAMAFSRVVRVASVESDFWELRVLWDEQPSPEGVACAQELGALMAVGGPTAEGLPVGVENLPGLKLWREAPKMFYQLREEQKSMREALEGLDSFGD